MTKQLPKVGDRIRFEDRNPSREVSRIMSGIVTSTSKIFGGHIHVKDVKSEDEFIIRLECVI